MDKIPQDLIDLLSKRKSAYKGYSSRKGIEQISYALQRLGYKWEGNGAYSLVVSHPSYKDRVIKITMSEKDGYHKYVEWVIENRDNLKKQFRRHLPVIHHTEVLGNKMRVTLLEKLEERRWGQDIYFTDTADILKNLISGIGNCFGRIRSDISTENNILYRRRVAVITDPWAHK